MRFALKVFLLTVLLTVASWFLLAKRTDDNPIAPKQAHKALSLPPDIDLGAGPTLVFPHAQLSCSLELRYAVPQVELRWNTEANHKFASLREEGSQSFATDYWPDTGVWLSESVLIIAGVSPETKRTLLERWTFEIHSEIPRAEWIAAEAGLAWLLPDRLSVERIYEGDEPGKRHIQSLVENRGQPGTLFASFGDSNGLYSIADGTVRAEPLGVAPNSDPLSLLAGENLESGGFEYTLFFGPRNLYCGSDLHLGTFVQVLDEDGDGILDRILKPESAQ